MTQTTFHPPPMCLYFRLEFNPLVQSLFHTYMLYFYPYFLNFVIDRLPFGLHVTHVNIVSEHIILCVGKGEGVIMGMWHHGAV